MAQRACGAGLARSWGKARGCCGAYWGPQPYGGGHTGAPEGRRGGVLGVDGIRSEGEGEMGQEGETISMDRRGLGMGGTGKPQQYSQPLKNM